MEGSRIEKVQKNIVSALIVNFLNILLAFISRIIFIRILGAEYLGINGLFSNILSILSLADLGMTTAMTYNLYKPIAEHDTEKIAALIYFFKKIYLTIASVVLIIGICLLPFLRYIINLEQDIPNLEVYYLLSVINVAISYLFVYRTTLIHADQKGYVLNKYIMIFRVLTTMGQVLILLLTRNYLAYLLVAMFLSVLSNFYQSNVVSKLYPYIKQITKKINKQERQRIFKDVRALFLYRICGTIQSNTDSILISIFVGTIYVGYYSNYILLMTQIVGILTIVFNSLKASVGNLLASAEVSKEETMKRYKVLEFLNFWLIAFCAVCFVGLYQEFISLCFGTEYLLEFSLVIAIVLNFYTSNIRQTLWVFREASGVFDETKYITAATAVLNLIFSLVMGYYGGMTGIILATVISRMVYAWWKEPMILFEKCFNLNGSIYLKMYIRRIMLAFFMCICTCILCYLVNTGNLYVDFLLHILICCVVPNVIVILIYRKSEEFNFVLERIVHPVFYKVIGYVKRG